MESQITLEASKVIYVLACAILFIGQTFLGWFLKSLFEEIKQLRMKDEKLADKVQALAEILPASYIARPEFKDMSDALFSMLRRIEDKIDRKADK